MTALIVAILLTKNRHKLNYEVVYQQTQLNYQLHQPASIWIHNRSKTNVHRLYRMRARSYFVRRVEVRESHGVGEIGEKYS